MGPGTWLCKRLGSAVEHLTPNCRFCPRPNSWLPRIRPQDRLLRRMAWTCPPGHVSPYCCPWPRPPVGGIAGGKAAAMGTAASDPAFPSRRAWWSRPAFAYILETGSCAPNTTPSCAGWCFRGPTDGRLGAEMRLLILEPVSPRTSPTVAAHGLGTGRRRASGRAQLGPGEGRPASFAASTKAAVRAPGGRGGGLQTVLASKYGPKARPTAPKRSVRHGDLHGRDGMAHGRRPRAG
jgi:hypothetical protein